MLADYRSTGLEFADKMRAQVDEFYALTRYLTLIKTRQIDALEEREGLGWEAAQQRLQPLDDYSARVTDAIAPVQGIVDELKGRRPAAQRLQVEPQHLGTPRPHGTRADAARQAGRAAARRRSGGAAAVAVEGHHFEMRSQPLMDALQRFIAPQTNSRRTGGIRPRCHAAHERTDEQVARKGASPTLHRAAEQTEAELTLMGPDRRCPSWTR
jgi:hypothetical protein